MLRLFAVFAAFLFVMTTFAVAQEQPMPRPRPPQPGVYGHQHELYPPRYGHPGTGARGGTHEYYHGTRHCRVPLPGGGCAVW